MKAFLIAGGFGTRMRPLTYTRPKHLLPIANRPHIEHVFDLLQRHGVHDVVLLTSYLAEAFEATIARATPRGLALEVAHETEPLGTAGAIKNAEPFLDGGTFLAFNGDVLTDVDLGAVLAFHRERSATGTILLTPVEDPSAFGVVPTSADGRVESFIEKPAPGTAPTNMINAGMYVLEPSVLETIPAGQVCSIEREVFPALVERDAGLYAVGTDSYWIDVGTPQKYLQANLDALRGTFATDAVPDPGPRTNAIADDARLQEGATVASSAIGRGVKLASGAVVEDSVLLDGVVVGSGARVERCILGEGATVAPDTWIVDRTFGDGESVG